MAMRELKGEKQKVYPLEEGTKTVRDLPSFQITEDDLPEMKDWEVGDEYEIKIKVKMTFLAKGKEWQASQENEKEPMRAKFDIVALETKESKQEENEAKDMGSAMPHFGAGMKQGETFKDAYARKRSAGAAKTGN
jgi:hypothetical protein